MKSFFLRAAMASAMIAHPHGALADDVQGAASAEPLPKNRGAGAGPAALTPMWGDISPFWGDISPFWGDISPFWGDISPFWGDISPFWGDISPFWGDISPFEANISPEAGGLEAFWGDLNAFWGDIAPFWGDLSPFWADAQSFDDFREVAAGLSRLLNEAHRLYEPAIIAQGGESYDADFVAQLAQTYDLDVEWSDKDGYQVVNEERLAQFTEAERNRFFTDYYDGLMQFNGADRVDHWMATANWRPTHTQDLSYGMRSNIGILDGALNGTYRNVVELNPDADGAAGGHGIAVASLLVAPHDGEGLMGIAPHANVYHYNPFNRGDNANWVSVQDGIVELANAGAHVINMSLGQPGFVATNDLGHVLSSPDVTEAAGETVFVKAAGNEGEVQPRNLNWGADASALLDHTIFVGSVNPLGEISSFSNTPGDACVRVRGECTEQLMNRFIVAPGEALLVEDENGETFRASGTSFAAPLVSGAIALIHGRWPWLQHHASETSEIVFRSARDLGEPGVDGVYGHGLLDVEAALSPLDFDQLIAFQVQPDLEQGYAHWSYQNGEDLKNLVLDPGLLGSSELFNEFIYAFEIVDRVWRDFAIPLSTLQQGSDLSLGYREVRAQSYILDRMIDWANGGEHLSDQMRSFAPLARGGQFDLALTGAPRDDFAEHRDGELPIQLGVEMTDATRGLSLKIGHGGGAMALSSTDGFAFRSDHDAETGGVNPVLGLASGGGYAAAALDIAPGTTISAGFTTHSQEHETRVVDAAAPRREDSSAVIIGVSHHVSQTLTATASYTQLQEEDGVLGAYGVGPVEFSGDTASHAATFAGEWTVDPHLSVSASATIAKTEAGDANAPIRLSEEGAVSTAFQVSAERYGVFAEGDALRVSLTQPLHVEKGQLDYSSVQITDRSTGEIGVVERSYELSGDRPLVGEALYSRSMLNDRARISAFARGDLSGVSTASRTISTELGVRASVRF